jgi:SPX domain protein involved in polyphosphate accumulation
MYRYERKYYLPDANYHQIKSYLNTHPGLFKKAFDQRVINNIYFDSGGFAFYYDNLDGERERKKIRIRWYGNTFEHQKKLTLEHKIKNGLVGRKDSFCLENINTGKGFTFQQLRKQIKSNDLPFHIKHELLNIHPTLFNTYNREYYITEDGKFRITLDRNLKFYRIHSGRNNFTTVFDQGADIVLELKYDPEFETCADNITKHLPFKVTKSSKYVIGIQNLFGII